MQAAKRERVNNQILGFEHWYMARVKSGGVQLHYTTVQLWGSQHCWAYKQQGRFQPAVGLGCTTLVLIVITVI